VHSVQLIRSTTLWTIKRWQYIFEHNFEKCWSIFIIFALLYTGRNFLHMHEKYPPRLNIVLTLPCENEASHAYFYFQHFPELLSKMYCHLFTVHSVLLNRTERDCNSRQYGLIHSVANTERCSVPTVNITLKPWCSRTECWAVWPKNISVVIGRNAFLPVTWLKTHTIANHNIAYSLYMHVSNHELSLRHCYKTTGVTGV